MAPKSLVVVESPSKARTIKKYLGSDFEVMASVGHVKDLPKSRMGVDIEGDFEPLYETIHGKGKILQAIRKAARSADMVYLAPDPDREGEAIAWHIADELKIPDDKVRRVLFNEITKRAITAALAKPQELNRNRYNSQQARRILDRLVGYQISPLLWDKVRRGLSAGRVQSVAVRIVVTREREVLAFDPVEYWTVDAALDAGTPPRFKAKLARIGQSKAELSDGQAAQAVVDAVGAGPFQVAEVKRRERRQTPQPPFTTSRLQQDAARAFRFTAKRTMSVAQRLYEGVELGSEGAVGLITYMRTDSTRLSDDALADVRRFVGERYGAEFLPPAPQVYKSKGRAQDAHEAIRPTSLDYPPERVKSFLKAEEHKLYSLIWNRFLACQMAAARFDMTTVDVAAPGGHLFRATGQVMTFSGFTAVYEEQRSEDDVEEKASSLPLLKVGQTLAVAQIEAKQHFTQPPPRFTEASLVRELEEKGIGRPSTYAAIISTIQDKKYVDKQEGRFLPTELGSIVTDLLVGSFPQLFDVGFTARMEDQLDLVEDASVDWKALLAEFWGGLSQTLETARTQMRNVKREETPTELVCPRDGATLVIKFGKNGSFLACSSYPDCTFTGEFNRGADGTIRMREDELVGEPCSRCEGGQKVYKTGRFGRFIGCSNYPECTYTEAVSTGVTCPRCKEGVLAEKRSRRGKVFYSCSRYPECDYAQWDRPIPTPCPACHGPHLDQKTGRNGSGSTVCPACGHTL